MLKRLPLFEHATTLFSILLKETYRLSWILCHYQVFQECLCGCLLVCTHGGGSLGFVLSVDLLGHGIFYLQLCLIMPNCSPGRGYQLCERCNCVTLSSNLCQTFKGNIFICISLITGEGWHLLMHCLFKGTLL